MTYSASLGDFDLSSLSKYAPPAQPGPYDYLDPGSAGLAFLQEIATNTADLLVSGKGGYVTTIRAGTQFPTPIQVYVPANQLISAIWGGHADSARLFASVMVSTVVMEQRRTQQRLPITSLAPMLVTRLTDALLNNKDPASCMIAFESQMGSWKSLYPVVRSPQGMTNTGWCQRDLVFTGGCSVGAVCAMKMDAKGNVQLIAAAPPPPGAITTAPPATASAPVPPPTHAQITASIEAQMAASGESYDAMERVQELSELGVYLSALSQARLWLCMALGLPTTAPDQAIWAALSARGISAAEAIDWFTSCDAGLDCFRQRMNAALGETDMSVRDAKSKTMIGLGVAAACAFAFLTWRRR